MALMRLPSEAQAGQSNRDRDTALSRQALSTTLSVATDEFENYQLGSDESLITVSLKEFKAIIEFAVGVGNNIDLHFSAGGEPLLVSLETDALLIDFVLSTNSDDPAGIQREKDIKPRLTQMKLDSAPPPARPTAHSRARSVRPSVPPAPSANFSKHVGLASHAHESRPLFNPPDDDDQMEETEGDNEDTLWNDIDQADPTFSQLALNLETSTPQPAYEEGNREEKPTRQPRKQPEVIDMSLEDDSDASSTCMPTAKSKKSKKNWQLGI
ncbi:MAG: Cell cycle checkpoint control protein rad9b [Cyphobasidiales sp. Tagirdzhanova-0007]|nr:MAG: Cell cycle checkpoint control protein rad9b [Cyphobasidiales sp. Tagirdzhanova-0007]